MTYIPELKGNEAEDFIKKADNANKGSIDWSKQINDCNKIIKKSMSKELWEELREIEIIAEMREDVYMDIPSHLRDQMKIKRIDQPNFRPIYEKDAEWKKRHQSVIDAAKLRAEKEDEIRANFKTEK